MKFKVKYTLTLVQEEDTENWESTSIEDTFKKIQEYCKDDPAYAIENLAEKGELTMEWVP